MKRPADIRTPPRGWVRVLEVAYPFLRDRGLGDLLLFGSQALSVYMETPLRSKDLDLVSSQIGPRQHEALSEQLSKTPGLEVRSSTVQSRPLAVGMLKTYSVEVRLDGRPFFVEIFDKILDGRSPSILAQHVREKKKWGLRLWVPTPSSLAALRLCFRPPEGISPLNAARLNRFIRQKRKQISLPEVGRIIAQWNLQGLVEQNLEDLYRRHRMKILNAEKIFHKPSHTSSK